MANIFDESSMGGSETSDEDSVEIKKKITSKKIQKNKQNSIFQLEDGKIDLKEEIRVLKIEHNDNGFEVLDDIDEIDFDQEEEKGVSLKQVILKRALTEKQSTKLNRWTGFTK